MSVTNPSKTTITSGNKVPIGWDLTVCRSRSTTVMPWSTLLQVTLWYQNISTEYGRTLWGWPTRCAVKRVSALGHMLTRTRVIFVVWVCNLGPKTEPPASPVLFYYYPRLVAFANRSIKGNVHPVFSLYNNVMLYKLNMLYHTDCPDMS